MPTHPPPIPCTLSSDGGNDIESTTPAGANAQNMFPTQHKWTGTRMEDGESLDESSENVYLCALLPPTGCPPTLFPDASRKARAHGSDQAAAAQVIPVSDFPSPKLEQFRYAELFDPVRLANPCARPPQVAPPFPAQVRASPPSHPRSMTK
jgi:hypothetical protein